MSDDKEIKNLAVMFNEGQKISHEVERIKNEPTFTELMKFIELILLMEPSSEMRDIFTWKSIPFRIIAYFMKSHSDRYTSRGPG
jgi:hypothetical protein